ncbi:MAG: S8 family serine peptidase [Verrucomicrobiota bacterium]
MAYWLTLEQAAADIRSGTGQGVKIAVIDSGIETSHPDLKGIQLCDDLAVVEEDISLKVVDGGGVDMFGHGTAIASIIRSVAPEAQIGSFRVLGDRLQSRTAIIREGVRLALDRGYHILNCSFGCRGEEQFIMKYKDWVDEAYLKGVHVISACNNCDFTVPEWPGFFTSAITVNMATTTELESFYYRPGTLVEFAAVGVNVDVAWKGGGRRCASGSSYAAPRVAAMLARLLSVHPQLSPAQAKALMHQIATPWTAQIAADNVPA